MGSGELFPNVEHWRVLLSLIMPSIARLRDLWYKLLMSASTKLVPTDDVSNTALVVRLDFVVLTMHTYISARYPWFTADNVFSSYPPHVEHLVGGLITMACSLCLSICSFTTQSKICSPLRSTPTMRSIPAKVFTLSSLVLNIRESYCSGSLPQLRYVWFHNLIKHLLILSQQSCNKEYPPCYLWFTADSACALFLMLNTRESHCSGPVVYHWYLRTSVNHTPHLFSYGHRCSSIALYLWFTAGSIFTKEYPLCYLWFTTGNIFTLSSLVLNIR